MTGVFCQTIFQYISNDNFGLIGELKVEILGLGKVWHNLYVLVLVYFLALRMSITEKFLLDDISLTL